MAPVAAPAFYQAVHVNLLRALDSLESQERFRRYADRWQRAALASDATD
jgi:hypothetical protein